MDNVTMFVVVGIVFTITFGVVCGLLITELFEMRGLIRFIVATLIASAIGFGISGLLIFEHTTDEKQYNEGYCECGGEWDLFDIEKGYRNGSSTYYYKCNKCNDVIETHTNFKKTIDN